MKKIILSVFTFICLFLITGHVKANQFQFSVIPEFPENQVQKNLNYYNLLMKAGQKQMIHVDLANQTDKKVTINIGISSSTTNINGTVEYSPNNIQADKSLKYNLKDLLKGPEQVVLEAHQARAVEFQVVMAASDFTGIIAGGLTFKQDEKELEENLSKNKGVTVNNEYQFVIGFLMQQKMEQVAPVLDLNNVFAGQTDARNSVLAHFENSAATFLKNMTVDAKITPKDGQEVLYQLKKDQMSMAPNSSFNLPLMLAGKRFLARNYTYTADVYAQKDSTGKYSYGKDATGAPQRYAYHWKFSRDFSITNQEAITLNAKDVSVSRDNTWLYWLIGVFLILLALMLFLLMKKRRRKEENSY